MIDPALWQPLAGDASRRDLPGPYWAEVRRCRFHQMPQDDPGTWSWAIRRLGAAGHRGTGHTTIKAGTAVDDHAAKQAVEDWLAAHPLDGGRAGHRLVAGGREDAGLRRTGLRVPGRARLRRWREARWVMSPHQGSVAWLA